MAGRRGFGAIRKLPSGRYQASYVGPDRVRRAASDTFDTREDAERVAHRPAPRDQGRRLGPTGGEEGRGDQPRALRKAWLTDRQLKPRTRTRYRWLLDSRVLPALGAVPVKAITPATVRTWHAGMDAAPTARAHAYALLKSILARAVEDELIGGNPCRIRGASKAKRAREIHPATLDELAVITE